jgi:undecaprenyl-phosphate 4-deoxy-4-formamido-L-arabinose transferase
LSRNGGEYAAVVAGLHFVRGQWTAVVDDDGQQAAADVVLLFRAAETGAFDVVYGRYRKQRQPWHRRLVSRLHNTAAVWLLGKPRELYLSSFKVLSRFIVDQLCEHIGPFSYLDGFILGTTTRIAQVDVEHQPRLAGRSGYSFSKLLRLWFEAVLGYSPLPFRAARLLGVVVASLGVCEAVAAAAAGPADRTTFNCGVLLLACGAILTTLGFVGEVVRRGLATRPHCKIHNVRYVLRGSSRD